jgi:hypothetical protein
MPMLTPELARVIIERIANTYDLEEVFEHLDLSLEDSLFRLWELGDFDLDEFDTDGDDDLDSEE